MSGKKSCQGKLSKNCTKNCINRFCFEFIAFINSQMFRMRIFMEFSGKFTMSGEWRVVTLPKTGCATARSARHGRAPQARRRSCADSERLLGMRSEWVVEEGRSPVSQLSPWAVVNASGQTRRRRRRPGLRSPQQSLRLAAYVAWRAHYTQTPSAINPLTITSHPRQSPLW